MKVIFFSFYHFRHPCNRNLTVLNRFLLMMQSDLSKIKAFLIFPMLGFKIRTIFNYKIANIFGLFENILKGFLPVTIISNAAKFTQPMQKVKNGNVEYCNCMKE